MSFPDTTNAGAAAPGQDAPLAAWVVTDGRTGIEIQARGLVEAVLQRAQALGRATQAPRIVRIAARRPWVWLPPRLWRDPLSAVEVTDGGALAPPWPDLLVSTGRRSAAVTAEIRRRSRAAGGRTYAVHIQDPYQDFRRFDLVVVPRHDRVRGPNLAESFGALGLVTPERLAEEAAALAPDAAGLPRPRIAVSVGGSNRVFRLGTAEAERLAEALRRAQAASGGSLLVTVSRRTGAAATEVLRRRLADLPGRFHDGSGANPYFAFLGLADAIVVTCDSVNMASEAAATGKPVHVFMLPGGSRKFARFHADLRDAGIARIFDGGLGEWGYQPLDETARIAKRVVADLSAGAAETATPRASKRHGGEESEG
jgi:mitochondrial fission protein ELM1